MRNHLKEIMNVGRKAGTKAKSEKARKKGKYYKYNRDQKQKGIKARKQARKKARKKENECWKRGWRDRN